MFHLSIVVAIYNVDRYLKKCIDSILNQTYKDFELILVDDGSTDKCGEICDKYKEIDKRVIVIHKNNGGSVSARREGLLHARGEFISFVDGDDWLDYDMYEKMMPYTVNADIVVSGYKQYVEHSFICKRNSIDSGVYSGRQLDFLKARALYDENFYTPGIIPALWNKIFRKEILLENKISVDSSVRMGDDSSVTYPAIFNSNTVVVINDVCSYNYRVVSNSISHSFDISYFDRTYLLIKYLSEYFPFDSLMSRNLDYYMLFMLRYGFNYLFSKKCKIGFFQKLNILSSVVNKFNLKKTITYIDWFGFEKKDKLYFQNLVRQSPIVFYTYYKFNRLIKKVGK